MSWTIAFDPLVPWWLIAAGAVIAMLVVAVGVLRHVRGALVRGLAFLALLAALADPSLVEEQRNPLQSVVAVVADRSPSQDIGTRATDTTGAVDALVDRLQRLPDVEVRRVDTGAGGTRDGTQIFADVSRALSDVPPDRIGGIIAVTDGVVHDAPADVAGLGFDAPVHGLITGSADEFDRRIAVVSAPKFGLVGSTQPLRFRVDDHGAARSAAAADIVIRRDGEEIQRLPAVPGQEIPLELEITHGGSNIFEIETPPIEGELSAINNRTVAVVQGIRENLRVLLVSGEPHAGERTWRNLLKSDASVDLVHFTILRPPEKQDGTPINELSLIAFPTRELFATKIDEFDLIIFDRYQRRGVLPLIYFDNIARYVADGGAVLIAAGPDPGDDSVYDTPLAPALPARPTGDTLEVPFKAVISDAGKRHPVTRDLPGDSATEPTWSRWFRLVEADAERGSTVMDGPDGRPLLVLSHEGEGRVAMLLSDHVWLWARGFEGGGPHVPLLRRLAHWLMKEPDLEEEALRLYADDGDLVVERQTLESAVSAVTLTLPSGETREMSLSEDEPGLFRARMEDAPLGLHRADDGELTALAHVGPTDPREFRTLISTTEVLEPIARATRGSVQRLKSAADAEPVLPRIVPQRGGTAFGGSGWIGLDMSDAYEVTGIRETPLLGGFLGLALFLLMLGSTWWREGR